MARQRRSRRVVHSPARRSVRLYVRVSPRDIAMFRFFLEAYDNLAVFTVTDREKGILLLRFSPHQRKEMRRFLDDMRDEMDISEIFTSPLGAEPAPLQNA